MDKVKLPNEVAGAIESLSKKWGKKAFLNEDYWKSSTHPEVKVIDKYFDPFGRPNVNLEDGFDMLVRALYIGYEIEETPEDKVRKYYHSLKRDEDWEPNEYQRACGVIMTLDLLGIKIEGVNS